MISNDHNIMIRLVIIRQIRVIIEDMIILTIIIIASWFSKKRFSRKCLLN